MFLEAFLIKSNQIEASFAAGPHSVLPEGSHVAFDSGEQCDAQEFWTEMFNQLPEEYQRGFNIGIKKNYTCKKCGHVSFPRTQI